MRLHPAGREYATWDITGADEATTLAMSIDGGLTWASLARPTATTARALIAGPAATDNPAGTVVLPLGRSVPLIRATDTPEVVIVASGGAIDVKAA